MLQSFISINISRLDSPRIVDGYNDKIACTSCLDNISEMYKFLRINVNLMKY